MNFLSVEERARKGMLQSAEIIGLSEDPGVDEDIKKVIRDTYDEEDYIPEEDSIIYGNYTWDINRDDELSYDGVTIAIPVKPSTIPFHHRVARRLEVKFKTSSKEATLAAYCLYIVAELNKEVIQWFENLIQEKGWDEAFKHIRFLTSELRKEAGKDTDAMGRVEESLPEAVEYTAIPLNQEEEGEWKISYESQKFNSWAKKIKKAGVNNIGLIGKEMYGQKLTGSFDLDKELWSIYKARKQELSKISEIKKQTTGSIGTCRIGEKVNGVVVDITVKNNPSHILAPTWELVLGFKRGKLSWSQYEKKYRDLIASRLTTRKKELDLLVRQARTQKIYLACFCSDERFCHRRLAREIIKELYGV